MKDDEKRPDYRERWLKSMEEYYRDEYPDQMRKQVMEILPKSKDRLKVLYDIITRDGKAWMKAIRVPDVSAVEKAKTEMYEAYPEFSARSLETPERAQISDDAGFDPAPIFEQLRKKMQERKERIQK